MTHDRQHLWAIVLAGGEGERLKPYVRECYGTDRPKQFCSFAGRHTLVEETVLRAETMVPPEQVLSSGSSTIFRTCWTVLPRDPLAHS